MTPQPHAGDTGSRAARVRLTIVLGPVPCKACREPVVWNGWEWCNWHRMGRHVCRRPA